MTDGYRILLSCASSLIYPDMFEPGIYETEEEAEEHAQTIRHASPGVEVYALPANTDPREALHAKGWI